MEKLGGQDKKGTLDIIKSRKGRDILVIDFDSPFVSSKFGHL